MLMTKWEYVSSRCVQKQVKHEWNIVLYIIIKFAGNTGSEIAQYSILKVSNTYLHFFIIFDIRILLINHRFYLDLAL